MEVGTGVKFNNLVYLSLEYYYRHIVAVIRKIGKDFKNPSGRTLGIKEGPY